MGTVMQKQMGTGMRMGVQMGREMRMASQMGMRMAMGRRIWMGMAMTRQKGMWMEQHVATRVESKRTLRKGTARGMEIQRATPMEMQRGMGTGMG